MKNHKFHIISKHAYIKNKFIYHQKYNEYKSTSFLILIMGEGLKSTCSLLYMLIVKANLKIMVLS